ncbi:MAG: type IVB secretion system protein IcmH/DotU [Paracoccaceae bacterium]
MTKDDPFGLENDAGRTRIRPAASQRPAAAPAGKSSYGRAAEVAPDQAARVRQSRANDNPLIAAFAALMGLAPELESAVAPENPEVLRARLLDNLTYARDNTVAGGVALARADQAAWFVGAVLDDIALNTPWGGSSAWPGQPLVASLYGDVDAGEQFFDRTETLMRYPERDPEMLELAFMCLSLGFRGKHRVSGAAGDGALAQLRSQLARLLRQPDDDDAALAPHWQGVVAADEPARFALPLWSILLVAVALITAVYIGLSSRLSTEGQHLSALANLLPPPERADIFRPVRESGPVPVLEIERPVFELLPLVAAAAPADTANALTGREDVSLAIVVVQSTEPEVFRSAKAALNDIYLPLIESIAAVILENQEAVGGVTIVGHTDSIPVQRSNPFASNQRLSEARAKTIADLLISAGVAAGIIKSEGRAEAEPIADNATREGRARNRRVEIIIEKRI